VLGRTHSLVIVAVFALGWAAVANAGTVTLAWNANGEPNLAGYRVSYGTTSRVYTAMVDVGMTTTWTTPELPDGFVYYFAVQAYNTAGVVSAYSAEVFTWVGPNDPPVVDAGFDVIVTFGAPGMIRGSVTDDGRGGGLTMAWSVTGGPGTVTFDSPSAVATIARFSAPGSYYLRLTANDGTLAVFDDVAVLVASRAPTSHPHDIDANGYPDLYWQHDEGWFTAWLMQDTTAFGGLTIGLGRIPDYDYRVVGTGDLDLDGDLDFFWQHRTQGFVAAWIMNGTSLVSALALTPGQVSDLSWKIKAVADLNGDRYPDLIWQHAVTGHLKAWMMLGTTRTSEVNLTPGQVEDPSWEIVGAGDLNWDGRTDLVWQHQPSGIVAAWMMNGTTLVETRSLTPNDPGDANWKVRAVMDLNRDGNLDLIWQHQTDGWLNVWFMNGTTRQENRALTPDRLADPKWKIVGPK